MINVQVGQNKYTDIEQFTTAKLEHMLQRAEQDAKSYEVAIRNYSPEKMEKFGSPFVEMMMERVKTIRTVLEARR